MYKKQAKIMGALLGFGDHGFFTVMLHVDYGSSAQGIGGFVLGAESDTNRTNLRPIKAAAEFIMRVLEACGVREWAHLKGRTIYVLFEKDGWSATPLGIENLPTERGCQFLFKPWQERANYEQEVERELIKTGELDAGKLDTKRWLPGWSH